MSEPLGVGNSGVKETKEGAVALIALGVYVVELSKDGLDISDAMALAARYQTDPVFAGKLRAGIEGYDKIALELKDLSVAEGVELVSAIGIEVVRALQGLK